MTQTVTATSTPVAILTRPLSRRDNKGSTWTDMLCKYPDVDPRLHVDPKTWDDVRTAAAICMKCPSLEWCRNYAEANRGDIYGVAAGRFYRQRLLDDPEYRQIFSRTPRDIDEVWGELDHCLECGGDLPNPRADFCGRECYITNVKRDGQRK